MISRCKFCGDIAPQGRTMCDSCFRLEYEDEPYYPVEDSYDDYEEDTYNS